MNKTAVRDAIVDMVKALKPVFKRYSRHARTEAWEKLSGKRGDNQMKKILNDPDRPLNTFKQLAFREWLYDEPDLDLRQDYDEKAEVENGTIYRKGKTVQAWWTKDARKESFEKAVAETWTAPNEQQAIDNFKRMTEDV